MTGAQKEFDLQFAAYHYRIYCYLRRSFAARTSPPENTPPGHPPIQYHASWRAINIEVGIA